MTWFAAPDAWLGRFVFQRGLAAVYVLAFLVAINQFRPLLGDRGLLPVSRFLHATSARDAPTLFRIRYSDGVFLATAWCGLLLSIAAALTLPDHLPAAASALLWFVMWALYLSIVNVGQVF